MSGFRVADDALIWEFRHETVLIQPWGRDSLRVRATRGSEVLERAGALVDDGARPASEEHQSEISVSDCGATIRNGRLRAAMDQDGILCFEDAASGVTLLQETSVDFTRPPSRDYRAVDGDLYHIEVRFKAVEGERFYGLGQHQHGLLDQKGCVIDLRQRNTEVSIPFVLSSRGFGFLWNNPAVGRVELGRNETRWVAEAARQIDYWVTAGDSFAAILEQYADASGHAPVLPEWAAGFWQSRLRYRTQEELLVDGTRVQASRPAHLGDRVRFLPLDDDGQLAVRSGLLARSGRDGCRVEGDGHLPDGFRLAERQRQQPQLRAHEPRGVADTDRARHSGAQALHGHLPAGPDVYSFLRCNSPRRAAIHLGSSARELLRARH